MKLTATARNVKHHIGLLLGLLGVASPGFAAELPTLTLKQAQEIALQKHPRITAAELRALAAQQVTIQVRSVFFPNFTANLTAVGAANDNTRIAAGGLNNPAIFERFASGLTVSQLLTDFGRTAHLDESSRLRARAEAKNTEVARAQVLFLVDASYFTALEAQALVALARQTMATRQAVLDRLQALANNQLRSDLDVSFARVSLEEGKLLLAKAQNDLKSASEALATLLGYSEQPPFQLGEEPMPPELSTDTVSLVKAALQSRPELARLRLERDAALKFAAAERGLHNPTLSAIGSIGHLPLRDNRFEENYAAAGVNLSFPLFNGNLFTARRKEAELRAQALTSQLRDEENELVRDVRIARLNVDYARERLQLTAKLLEHSHKAFDLAKTRYELGSSSIVELSQALLNQTTAEIAQTDARYEHHLKRAVLDYKTGALK